MLLNVFGWDCAADCSYKCMTHIERERRARNLETLKYHGKWPFVRIAGMQEAASVCMSVLNLVAHLRGATQWTLQRRSNQACSNLYAKAWWVYIAISCNSWVWSAAFHSRDTSLTERLDYLSAFAVVITGLCVCIVRVFGLKRASHMLSVGAVGLCAWVYHSRHMLIVKFDYGWNMTLCVACGILQSLLWLLWAFITRHSGRYTLLFFMLGANGALMLEILDFPPIAGCFDAHSLWHAATIPLTLVWYRFLAADDKEMAMQQAKVKL